MKDNSNKRRYRNSLGGGELGPRERARDSLYPCHTPLLSPVWGVGLGIFGPLLNCGYPDLVHFTHPSTQLLFLPSFAQSRSCPKKRKHLDFWSSGTIHTAPRMPMAVLCSTGTRPSLPMATSFLERKLCCTPRESRTRKTCDRSLKLVCWP